MNKPNARKEDIVVQQVENETLIYSLKENKAYCLNETSALVWSLCDGKRTTSTIADKMSKRLKTPINKEFVWLAIDMLQKQDLLANGKRINSGFENIPRREVIRKIGFTSAIALPMISNVVAPKAISAQSCVGNLAIGSTCQADCDCSSNSCRSVQAGITTGMSGDVCCTATGSGTFSPGANYCINSPSQCVTSGPINCCSGSAQAGPSIFQCSATTCVCN